MRVREMRRRGEVGRLCDGNLFCAFTEWRGTPVWRILGELWSRDVFVSLRDFVVEYYNMGGTSFKEFSHTAIISRYGPVAFMLDSVFPARRAPAAALLVEFGVGVVRMLQHRHVVHRMRRVLARVVHIWQRFGAVVLRAVRHRPGKSRISVLYVAQASAL